MKTTFKSVSKPAVLAVFLLFAIACAAQESGFSRDGTAKWSIIYYPKAVNVDITSPATKDKLTKLIKSSWIYSGAGTYQFFKSIELGGDTLSLTVSTDNPDANNKKTRKKGDAPLSNEKSVWVIQPGVEQSFRVTESQPINGEVFSNPYRITIDTVRITYGHQYLTEVKDLCDMLFSIQHQLKVKAVNQKVEAFKSSAEQYRNQQPKPTVSEEQRRLIVQANLFNQQKEYGKAIKFYKKALDIHATAYPPAYYNLALLLAQIHCFDNAIMNMKKYILLAPDAADARTAQDKIYEWEANFAY